MAPKVSILTATHNSLPGLRETVMSVASQTADDYEHIVIDGGSSDGTPEWLAKHDANVTWTSEPDDGIADALNKGLKIARGEWILVLHAEDTLAESGSMGLALASLDTPADIVSYDVLFVSEKVTRRLVSRGFSPRLNFKTTIPHQGAFCRRALYDQLGPFDSSCRIALDYEFFLRAYRAGVRADVVNHAISRMPDTGISSRLDWPSLRARFSEEKLIQLRHCSGAGLRLVYSLYWPLYMSYRWTRYMTLTRPSLQS